MSLTTIEVKVVGARGTIALNRPDKLNPLSTETLRELADAALWFDERPDVKVVVLSGSGRAFSSGADISVFAGADPGVPARREAADAGRLMAEAIESMRAITIARIQGHCVGGALVLVAACDLRVAADTTRFSIPEVDLGIPLAWGGIPRLVREIGPAMTKELVLTCRPFTAEEARALGFVNRVVGEQHLDEAVEELGRASRREVFLDPHSDQAGGQCRQPRTGVDVRRVERRRPTADRIERPGIARAPRSTTSNGLVAADVDRKAPDAGFTCVVAAPTSYGEALNSGYCTKGNRHKPGKLKEVVWAPETECAIPDPPYTAETLPAKCHT